MKKSLISMAAILFAALMTTTTFTSCGDDDDEPKKAELIKAVVKYTVTSDAETLGLFKVNVYGTDAAGTVFEETMSNPSYTKTVEIPVSKLPCTVELYTKSTALEDKAATEDFGVSMESNIDVTTVRSDNTVVDNKEQTDNWWGTKFSAGTSLSEFAETYMNSHTKLVMFIDANGNITDLTKK